MKWKNTAALAILLMVCLMLDACGASAFVGGKNDETALKETSQIATQSVQHTEPLTVVTEAVKSSLNCLKASPVKYPYMRDSILRDLMLP